VPQPRYRNDRDFSIENKLSKKKKRSTIGSFFSTFLVLLVFLAAVGAIASTILIVTVTKSLPTSDEILAHEPNLSTVIYDRNGKEITKLFQENRNWVKLDDISPWMIKAILAAEDSKFYEHSGIRPIAVARAAIVDFFSHGAKQGGSTITQQLARNLFLTKEKTIVRKVKEAVLSLRLEKIYSKDQLLEMYLNTIYMGHGAYGIDAASKSYFNKDASKLTIAESAILAGLVAAPEKYSPLRNKRNSDIRRGYVLQRMLDLDWISKNDYDENVNKDVKVFDKRTKSNGFELKTAPYFISYILFKQLLPAYGTERVYRGGLKVYTTIDLDLQKKAEQLVSKMGHEGALVAIDPNTGEILALVGGRNFETSKFNRATQAYRQPGSAFKPIVYSAALESGYRAVDHVLDAPLSFENGWSPKNYSEGYNGEVTLMTAIARSLNTVAVRLAQITGVTKVIDMARRMGITSKHLPEDLSIALGSASVTPLELCVAYCTFANNGYKVEPYGVKEVDSSTGETLEQTGPNLQTAMTVTNAVAMRSLLEQVIKWGTGTNARIENYESFGKTGTTNDWTDAWFAGGVPGLVAVVYTGNDNHTPLGGRMTGTVAAIPVWRAFMRFATKTLRLSNAFVLPPDAGVESVHVCTRSGFIAANGCRATDILLPAGEAPTAQCPWHGGRLMAAKEDPNAPQLILAPIDDEKTRYRYSASMETPRRKHRSSRNNDNNETQTNNNGTNSTETQQQEEQAEVVPPAETPVPAKKAKEPERTRTPSVQRTNPYKNTREAQDMERKYQDLLKQYKITD
jgi:penicillin-binding protein 1A